MERLRGCTYARQQDQTEFELERLDFLPYTTTGTFRRPMRNLFEFVAAALNPQCKWVPEQASHGEVSTAEDSPCRSVRRRANINRRTDRRRTFQTERVARNFACFSRKAANEKATLYESKCVLQRVHEYFTAFDAAQCHGTHDRGSTTQRCLQFPLLGVLWSNAFLVIYHENGDTGASSDKRTSKVSPTWSSRGLS